MLNTLIKNPPPAISVVIPVFDEQDNLPLLYQRLTTVLEEAEPDYEIVFVDDGSRDDSLKILWDWSKWISASL
jgi:glycosyltransferase involved in cell wall biosynthesis